LVIIVNFAEMTSGKLTGIPSPQFDETEDDYQSGTKLPHSKGCRRF
jgi:hypothetical protein